MERVTNEQFNADVYKDYTYYPEPTGRTKKILEFVKDKMPEPKTILDVGCGYGHGMKVMQEFFQEAKVSGCEPTRGLPRPNDKFDLITLFHVFEHVVDLREMLAYIKSSLTEDGHVLIQVPYAAMWPFDLVIADHEWHFTKEALMNILDKCGFLIDYIGNDVIRKEITVLAYSAFSRARIWKCEDKNNPVDWLLSFKSKLDKITEPAVVYGTSVSAMWAGNILGDKVICYIDDDQARWGKFNGKSAVAIIDRHMPVIAPFPDWQFEDIKAKHPNLRFL